VERTERAGADYLSAEPDDPGFLPNASRYVVLFNGDPQHSGPHRRWIFTAEEVAGLIR